MIHASVDGDDTYDLTQFDQVIIPNKTMGVVRDLDFFFIRKNDKNIPELYYKYLWKEEKVMSPSIEGMTINNIFHANNTFFMSYRSNGQYHTANFNGI